MHPSDHSPLRPLLPGEEAVSAIFNVIAATCLLDDPCAADPYIASPHTYFLGPASSRLDRIYLPKRGWSLDRLLTIPTHWSDHQVVSATCFVVKPRVQLARPAPRIGKPPDEDNLKFWSPVLRAYKATCALGPTLCSWVAFKTFALHHFRFIRKKCPCPPPPSWKDTLCKDGISRYDFDDALRSWLYRH